MKNMPPCLFQYCHLLLILLTLYSGGVSANNDEPYTYKAKDVYMRLIVRSPEQLSAFYQGRQFSAAAIERILQTCFITPIVKNKTYDVLWLDLDDWQFMRDGKPIKRIKRDYWKAQWQAVGLAQAYQSTFGWTLMPEQRDLRRDEGVGGSVAIPRQSEPFTLIARFRTGAHKQGPLKIIEFKGVSCSPKKP